MSCPHPREAVEKVLGPNSLMVCPDCNAPLSEVYDTVTTEAFEPDYTFESLDPGLGDPSLVCGEIAQVTGEDFDEELACGLEPGHEGDHDFSLAVEEPGAPASRGGDTAPQEPQGADLAPAVENDSTPAVDAQI